MYEAARRGVGRRIADLVLELLAPSVCLACERLAALRLGLCVRCRGRLKRLRPPLCRGCARPLADRNAPAGARCGSCRRRRTPLERVLAVWSYEPPFDAVIRALKYHRLEPLGAMLAREIAPTVPCEAVDLVVPVPLHWRRRLARGYNQAEAISAPLARRLALPHRRAVVRRRATAPQARLALDRRQRAAHLDGAFRCRRRLAGSRILLVDDVVTTGATLAAAATALRRAGADSVLGVAAGRTPEPGG